MEIGFFFIIIAVVVGSIIFSIHQSKKLDESWSAVARKMDLIYDPGSMMTDRSISGIIDGCAIHVATFTRGSGKNSKKYTRYQVSYPLPLRVQFRITRQGFMHGLTKALGAQDIEVGDREFDQLVMIKGDDAQAVAMFLTPERRERISRAVHDFNDVEIDELGIRSVYYGREASEPVMIGKIQRLVRFARTLAREKEASGSQPSPPPLRAEPILAHPGTILSQASAPSKPPPLPASSAPAVPEPPIPNRVEMVEKKPELIGEPASSVSAKTSLPVDASSIGQALFGQRLGITEIDKTFVAQYKDATVIGTGVLRSWAENSYDFVFGTGKFVKVTIEMPLEKSETNLHGSFQVMLKLPVSARTTDHGKEFSFTGRLVKADALMRQLYVDAFDESARS